MHSGFPIVIITGGELELTDEEIFEFMADEDEEVTKTNIDNLESIAAQFKIFSSKGNARKNGLVGGIPHGISLLGTKKKRVWIWNPNLPKKDIVFKKQFDHTDRWFENSSKRDET